MSDEWALFAVLGLVYLTDCFCWVGSSVVAFVGAMGASRAAKVSGDLLQTGEGSLVFLNPLPPLGTIYCCRLFPLAVSPDGVSTQHQSGLGFGKNGHHESNIPWDESGGFEARSRDLFLDGQRLLRCVDARQASEVCALLRQLRTASADSRRGILDGFWKKQFDLESAHTRLKSASSHLRGLRWACNGLFGLLFALAPGLVLYGGRVDMLIPLGVTALGIVLWIVVRFNAIFKFYFPEATDERVTHLIKMVLCPPASIRACDRISEILLVDHHPLLVAHLLMDPERFKTLSEKTLRALRFPIVLKGEAGYAGPVAWQNTVLLRKVETFLERIGLPAVDLLSPPAPHAPDVKAYCPRCLEQFMEVGGECPDCAGVMRVSFALEEDARRKRR